MISDFTVWCPSQSLELPLKGEGRNDIEAVVRPDGRPYKVVGQLDFGAYAELKLVVNAVEGGKVEPELGFAAENKVAVHAVVMP